MSTNSSANSTTGGGEAPFDLYPYTPSDTAAYAFVALFVLGAFTHFVLIFRFRAWFFIPFILGCLMEAAGYYARTMSHKDVRRVLPFIMQYILLLSSPPFLAATIYMILGRMGRNLNATDCSIIPPRWSTKLFVLADMACFVTQFAGAVMAGDTNPTTAENGTHIVLGGLFLQMFMFTLFVFLTGSFQSRFSRWKGRSQLSIKKHFIVLYIVSSVFLLRTIIRIIEFVQGDGGYIMSHEIMLYIFDGSFMLFIVYFLAVVHPGSLFKAIRETGGEFNEMAPLASHA